MNTYSPGSREEEICNSEVLSLVHLGPTAEVWCGHVRLWPRKNHHENGNFESDSVFRQRWASLPANALSLWREVVGDHQ